MACLYCPTCQIKFPAEKGYENCLACQQATVRRADSPPNRNYKQRAFESYYLLRKLEQAK